LAIVESIVYPLFFTMPSGANLLPNFDILQYLVKKIKKYPSQHTKKPQIPMVLPTMGAKAAYHLSLHVQTRKKGRTVVGFLTTSV